MKTCTAFLMAGIGFTVGLLCGLLVHLPAETLPANNFEGHHLSRVRRVAQFDSGYVGSEQGTASDYVNSNVEVNSLGTANKQGFREDLVNGDYIDFNRENLDQNGYKVIKNEKSSHFNALNKPPNRNYESVVYVNPDQQKLVLDNNVNNATDTNLFKEPYAADPKLPNTVRIDSNEAVDRPKNHAATGEKVAKGQNDRSSDKIKIDNYRKESVSSGNDVINGVYWSDSVEQSCPKGFSKDDHEIWKIKATSETFVKMNEGCGRMQNRILTFQNSEKACARYRLNVDQIQGEIYSYYLSKLLGINNVAPSVLQLADTNQDQWRRVGQEVATAMWSEERPVILSKWIDGLSPAYIPTEFRNLSNVLRPKDVSEQFKLNGDKLFSEKDGSSLCELMQWSDLIVFDYLTANLDRVVNNLFNLQWNSRMMSKPAHNLEKGTSGNLVFLDNESGLFHGYRLLDKYSTYHKSLLNSLCIFKKQTIDSLRHFVETDSISESLQSIFEANEPLHRYIPRVPAKNIKILKSRMDDILRQVQKCESQDR
ncbi:extracellular serine/threonine protein kinase four-jointed-like [Mercenaria mercenaria]|uniref:extracellular serine/threonine protein kinase four-jointed-like n=1 Tax=Mercenaria mercenaria TaxID=6596 RepID=UPI00234E7CC3|nr:extracellular serine/threonine protein kinase four-jointed-like [Mercenaria mercenaria]XP_053396149.1 extracellular serine/threonine protein kinase four-jointed-like [Mercenaria mercenaria]XP_053396150.1 extracellular serine/threonine protein kinase four-jointed-like [Mercenaria mercenaria]